MKRPQIAPPTPFGTPLPSGTPRSRDRGNRARVARAAVAKARKVVTTAILVSVCWASTAGATTSATAAALTGAARTGAARTAPAQTKTGGEFLSPTGNISCEIDNGYADLHQVYCETFVPPRSVVLSARGSLKRCSGEDCLSNPADGTPTLPYGRSTRSGPFSCLSEPDGVTCTVGDKGFQISRAGIFAVVVRPSS